MAERLSTVNDVPAHVANEVRILAGLLCDGHWRWDYTAETAENILAEMLASFEMQSHDGVYISVRKALIKAGVHCSLSHLQLPRNCLLIRQCIHAMYGAGRAPENIADYRRVQSSLVTVLSSPSARQKSGTGRVDPSYRPPGHVDTHTPPAAHMALSPRANTEDFEADTATHPEIIVCLYPRSYHPWQTVATSRVP